MTELGTERQRKRQRNGVQFEASNAGIGRGRQEEKISGR